MNGYEHIVGEHFLFVCKPAGRALCSNDNCRHVFEIVVRGFGRGEHDGLIVAKLIDQFPAQCERLQFCTIKDELEINTIYFDNATTAYLPGKEIQIIPI